MHSNYIIVELTVDEKIVTLATIYIQIKMHPVITTLTNLYNSCISEERVPSSWKGAAAVILNKKGDTANIKNYCPISLL